MIIDPHVINQWLTTYGSFALFGLLAVGIFGLPIPDETLMLLSGFLVANGKLNLIPTYLAAFLGSSCGITISYLLGFFLGKKVILRYGKWLHINSHNLERVHIWFEKFGKWLLTVGYFIPGVRHLTGIIAGTAYLEYWKFAIFAYTGALLWSSTFFSIGYFFFHQAQTWHLI